MRVCARLCVYSEYVCVLVCVKQEVGACVFMCVFSRVYVATWVYMINVLIPWFCRLPILFLKGFII